MSTAVTPSAAQLLHPVRVRELAREWLKEDTPSFDYGGFVVGEGTETAVLICKSPGVLAGVPFFDAIFHDLDCTVEWLRSEGEFIDPISYVARITGKIRNLLLGERVALNCVTRASGVATQARRLREIAKNAEWHGQVAGTRKTTPGFRMVEKHALLVGGISTHRYDLSSMIMLKDNHIWATGSITQAVRKAKSVAGFSTKVEVECRSTSEAKEAASGGADIVMLDNFSPMALHDSAAEIKAEFPHVIVEASGGITEDSITDFFGPDVDVISLSKTTQGYAVVDFSFKIVRDGHDPTNPTVVS